MEGRRKMPKMGNYFGATIKRLRTNAGKTLQEIAHQTGLSASHLSSMERGVAFPSLATLSLLAETYAVTPAFLIDDTIINHATLREDDIRYSDGTWRVTTCCDCIHRDMAPTLASVMGIVHMCIKHNAIFADEIPEDLQTLGINTMSRPSHQLKCEHWKQRPETEEETE
jgi:transcriptional regulator with XRE-family HTH domain